MIDYEKLEKHRLLQIDENRYVSKRMDEHEKCIGVLQSLVNDLRWRMDEIGNKPTATCCATHAGGHEECKPEATQEACAHTVGWKHYDCPRCFPKGFEVAPDKLKGLLRDECKHESDGKYYLSLNGKFRLQVTNLSDGEFQHNKCTKCGEFYR